MKKERTFAIVLLSIILNLNVYAQEKGTYTINEVDTLVNSLMQKYKIPGMVLGIIDPSNFVKLEAYGVADVQNNAPVVRATTFELGSLSKQFTAAAILKLQQDGKLSVEDYLFKYFPECPENWKEIKIKHLLWHTSGLPGMYPRDSFKNRSFTGYAKMTAVELDAMMQTNNVSKKTAIQSIISDSLDYQPGTKYNYSDVGYLVLGLIIDNVTGSYHDFMMDEVFKKCDMQNTYLLNQERVFPNQARGYSLKQGELINIMRTWDYEIPSYFGVFSNVQDLQKWDATLNSDDFLNEESKNFLFSKGSLNNGTKINYGGGWNIHNINKITYISHGGITGVNYIRIPQKGASVITLTNLGFNGHDPVLSLQITKDILNYLKLQEKISEDYVASDGSRIIKTNKRTARLIKGKYTTIDGIPAEIYSKENSLYFKCLAQGMDNRIAMLENGNFIVLDLDSEYIFHLDKENRALTSNLFRTFKKTIN